VKASTCSFTFFTTRSAEFPTLTTAIPAPISMMEFPSISTITPPPAFSTTTGMAIPRAAETASLLRLMTSCDFGPGIAVTTLRSCGIFGPELIGAVYLYREYFGF